MAIKIRSAKAKGARLQCTTRDAILDRFPTLTSDDVRSASGGSNGEDIVLSQAARKLLGLSVECKARATGYTSLYAALEQAERGNGCQPVAIVKQDRRKPLVVIDMEYFLDLVAELQKK